MTPTHLQRRHFLRAAGTAVALPMLESLPAAEPATDPAATAAEPKARRLVCIGAWLGLHRPAVYPKQTGLAYETTTTLAPLEHLRGKFTLFSGLDHRAPANHGNWPNYLCGSIIGDTSLDQRVASHVGQMTRFDSLVLACGADDGPGMCYSQRNVALPAIARPSVLYKKLFAIDGDRARTEYLLTSGRSVLDRVQEDARAIQGRVGSADSRKLDEYFTALRSVEKRMGRDLARLDDPLPRTEYRVPAVDPLENDALLECEAIMYDLMALALETDSSRVISLRIAGQNQVFTINGTPIRFGYHSMSHHGNDPDKIGELVKVDVAHMRLFARFLDQLARKTDATGRPLLDSTIVMWGTGMGDASRHSNEDLPTLVAGGGFRHKGHLAFPRTASATTDTYLGDLFISLQRQLGIDCQAFSQATRGIDAALA
jgi:hypothetical protein